MGSAKTFPSQQRIPELKALKQGGNREDTLGEWGSPRGCPTPSALCDELREKENKASKVRGKHISSGSDAVVFGKARARVASCAVMGERGPVLTLNAVTISRGKVWAWRFQVQKRHLYLCWGREKRTLNCSGSCFLAGMVEFCHSTNWWIPLRRYCSCSNSREVIPASLAKWPLSVDSAL